MRLSTLLVVICVASLTVVAFVVYGQAARGAKRRVPNDATGLYFRDRFGVYVYIPRDCGFLGCIGPDLRLLKYERIPRADPKTFEILTSPAGPEVNSGEVLARDRRHVFYGGRYVPTGDVRTLRVLDGYAKDKNNLYLHGMVIAGLDTDTARVLGRRFIADRDGLYVGNASPPRRFALADRTTFKMLPPTRAADGKYYVAEDKNFYYYDDGGSYLVESKPDTEDFKKLGCGYYYFKGRIFHTVYLVEGADAATFRVLGARAEPGGDVERCENYYAVDKEHRYQFELRVRPDDRQRNRQIDLLLAAPEDRKRMSEINYTYVCAPEYRPGINFGYSHARGDGSAPGTVTLLHLFEAGILEAQLTDADGRRQRLPPTAQRTLTSGCDCVRVERFEGAERKPWFGRRDPASVSLVVNRFGKDPVFVVADRRYSVRLAFSKTSLIRLLGERLAGSRLRPFDVNAAGWGADWILDNRFFLNREQVPEVWVPLRVKDVPTRYQEGHDFVTVGFKYSDGHFECVDPTQCATWGIPQRFEANFE